MLSCPKMKSGEDKKKKKKSNWKAKRFETLHLKRAERHFLAEKQLLSEEI